MISERTLVEIPEITEKGKQVYADLESDEPVVIVGLEEWLAIEAKGVVEDENEKFTFATHKAAAPR